MGRKPKNPYAALAEAARAHLRRANALGKSIDDRLEAKRKAAEDWVPDESFREDFEMVTRTLRDAGACLGKALEGEKKALGGMTEEQLLAQLKAEMLVIVRTLTDAEWQALVDARNKQ
jgi:hypothetical protein